MLSRMSGAVPTCVVIARAAMPVFQAGLLHLRLQEDLRRLRLQADLRRLRHRAGHRVMSANEARCHWQPNITHKRPIEGESETINDLNVQ